MTGLHREQAPHSLSTGRGIAYSLTVVSIILWLPVWGAIRGGLVPVAILFESTQLELLSTTAADMIPGDPELRARTERHGHLGRLGGE